MREKTVNSFMAAKLNLTEIVRFMNVKPNCRNLQTKQRASIAAAVVRVTVLGIDG